MIVSSRVFVGTTTAISSHLNLFEIKQFDLAIIDEASQILEPHLMGILSAQHEGRAAIRKFVMIGDEKQLPAVVQQSAATSAVEEPELRAIMLTDCRNSLFERMLRRYHDNGDVVAMLDHQGRMHPAIAEFPNIAFYHGRLKAVPLAHQEATLPEHGNSGDLLTDMLLTRRVAFIDAAKPATTTSDKVNIVEAEIIAALVRRIYDIEKATLRCRRDSGCHRAVPQPDGNGAETHRPLRHRCPPQYHHRHGRAFPRQSAEVYHLWVHRPGVLSA